MSRIFSWFLVLGIAVGLSDGVQASEPASEYVRKTSTLDTVIVFVHGLFGDATSTWTNGNAYWPRLLTEDSTFNGADIFVYEYPTSLWATLSIDELAENMRAVLSANRITAYHNIIFLSHSMGGLVTRAYPLKNREVAQRTSFAYFFSTPTTGSQVASILQYATALGLGSVAVNPQLAKLVSIKPEDYLGDLLRQWLAAKFEFPSYCAYEKQKTYGLMLVVSMESAASLCNRALDPIDADHIQIVKPRDENSASFVAFKAAYADARIPELRDKLDEKIASKLRSDLRELGEFPSRGTYLEPKTLMEQLVIDKTPQSLYNLLAQYNQADIIQLRGDGDTLARYKKEYYDYQVREHLFETNVLKKIGELVSVRFPAGWQIYLTYCLLRVNNSKEQIIAMGSFLNYDITWDDAERVWLLFQANKEINDQILALLSTRSDLFQRAHDILLAMK